jgi:hypothetical protein
MLIPTRDMGEAEDDRFLCVLYEELEFMGAPTVAQITATASPDRTRKALLGKFRVPTVKRCPAYWQGFRKWVVATYGKPPCQGERSWWTTFLPGKKMAWGHQSRCQWAKVLVREVCERRVMDDTKGHRLRAGAFVKLLKIWASLRFDDAAHVRMDMIRSYDKKVSA